MDIDRVVLQESQLMMVWMICIIGLLLFFFFFSFLLCSSPMQCLTEHYFIHSQLKNRTVYLTSIPYSPTPVFPNLVTSRHNYIKY